MTTSWGQGTELPGVTCRGGGTPEDNRERPKALNLHFSLGFTVFQDHQALLWVIRYMGEKIKLLRPIIYLFPIRLIPFHFSRGLFCSVSDIFQQNSSWEHFKAANGCKNYCKKKSEHLKSLKVSSIKCFLAAQLIIIEVFCPNFAKLAENANRCKKKNLCSPLLCGAFAECLAPYNS